MRSGLAAGLDRAVAIRAHEHIAPSVLALAERNLPAAGWICLSSSSGVFQGSWGKIEKAPLSEQQLRGVAAIIESVASIVPRGEHRSRNGANLVIAPIPLRW